MRQFYTMHNTCNGVSHIGLGSGINILSSKSYKIGYRDSNVPYAFPSMYTFVKYYSLRCMILLPETFSYAGYGLFIHPLPYI